MLTSAAVIAICEFGKEFLRTLNEANANRSPEEKKVAALVAWNIGKVFLSPFLTAEQKKQLHEQGIDL